MVSYTRLPSGSCMTLLNPAPVRLPHVLHFGHGSTDVFLIVLHHTVPRSRYKNSNLMQRTRYHPILSLNSLLALSFLICHLINFLPCQNPLASHSLLHGCQEAERNTDSITERRSYASVNTWTRQTWRDQHAVSTNSRLREESGEGTKSATPVGWDFPGGH